MNREELQKLTPEFISERNLLHLRRPWAGRGRIVSGAWPFGTLQVQPLTESQLQTLCAVVGDQDDHLPMSEAIRYAIEVGLAFLAAQGTI